jgi:hypothetical protein
LQHDPLGTAGEQERAGHHFGHSGQALGSPASNSEVRPVTYYYLLLLLLCPFTLSLNYTHRSMALLNQSLLRPVWLLI